MKASRSNTLGMRPGAVRFVLLGGFLGAGKTTAIARLARMFQDQGSRVGIITNDQADELVDTVTLEGQGFAVEQVAGACFCCHFDALTRSAAALEARSQPEVILAEPVGSCTDLVATVIRPLMKLFGDNFTLAPYGVLLKPEYARQILDEDAGTLQSDAAYIFRKQLEEADYIAVNKVDVAGRERGRSSGRACSEGQSRSSGCPHLGADRARVRSLDGADRRPGPGRRADPRPGL